MAGRQRHRSRWPRSRDLSPLRWNHDAAAACLDDAAAACSDDARRPRHGSAVRDARPGGVGWVLGMLGRGWWWWRRRPGCPPAGRFRRVRIALVAAGVVVIAVGAAWRLAEAIQHTPVCSPPSGVPPATRTGPLGPSLLLQKAATWPETGIGLLYSRTSDAPLCWSRSPAS